ncbi:MAG: hypothetical protein WC789_12055 [Lentisphaeria bacterium]|jgi:uroporphyrinogen decarboxylase
MMTYRERVQRCLHYESYDRLPVVHFGFWPETLQKWAAEGHITPAEAEGWGDGNEFDFAIGRKLGFDSNWSVCFGGNSGLLPGFEPLVLERLPNGDKKVRNGDGVVVLQNDAAGSIPAEIEHLLVDRKSWEEHYLPRVQYSPTRIDWAALEKLKGAAAQREMPLGIYCGSLFGMLRNWVGVVGASYIYADDEALFDEMINAVGELSFRVAQETLATGVRFDFAHFWEDICFKNGPLISPAVFREKVGPHYRRITGLLKDHGIDIVSVDCDGCIDALLPVWLENGVNTMFPIEVGTWNASIAPWRAKYGRQVRGVGGMNKVVFAHDFTAVDAEVERLKPLVALGGFIPCPDHRIAPDAKWEVVRHYCERMRATFG